MRNPIKVQNLSEVVAERILQTKKCREKKEYFYFGHAINQKDLPLDLGQPIDHMVVGAYFEKSDGSKQKTSLDPIEASSLDELCPKLLALQKRSYYGGDLTNGWVRINDFKAYRTGSEKPLPTHVLGHENLQRLMIVGVLYEMIGEQAFDDDIQMAIESILETGMGMMYNGNHHGVGEDAERILDAINSSLKVVYQAPEVSSNTYYDPRGMEDLFDFAKWYCNYFLIDGEKPNKQVFTNETKELVNERFIAAAMLPIH